MPFNISFVDLTLWSVCTILFCLNFFTIVPIITLKGMKKIIVAKPANAATPMYLQSINMQTIIWNGPDQIIFKNVVKLNNVLQSTASKLTICPTELNLRAAGDNLRLLNFKNQGKKDPIF